MSLRQTWQAHKHLAEETFKKAHAKELLKVDMEGAGREIRLPSVFNQVGPSATRPQDAILPYGQE